MCIIKCGNNYDYGKATKFSKKRVKFEYDMWMLLYNKRKQYLNFVKDNDELDILTKLDPYDDKTFNKEEVKKLMEISFEIAQRYYNKTGNVIYVSFKNEKDGEVKYDRNYVLLGLFFKNLALVTKEALDKDMYLYFLGD